MYNDLTYDAWLTEGNKFKHKYFMLQRIGLMIWAASTAYCVMGLHFGIIAGLIIGFIPYFLFYLAAMTFYEKWQACEDKYNHHVPFVDVKMMNVALAAVEFEAEKVTAHYIKCDGTLETIAIPADKVKLLPAEDDMDSMKLRKDFNNFTQKEEWIFCNIYLTPMMQNKLVELLAASR